MNGAEVILKVLIPQGTTASVVLPFHPQGKPPRQAKELMNGGTRFPPGTALFAS